MPSVAPLAPHTPPRHASAGSHAATREHLAVRHREAGGEGGGGRTKSSTKRTIIDSIHPCCAGPARRLAAASGAESSSGIPGAVGAVPAAPGAPEPTAAMRSRGRSIPASPSAMLLPRRFPTLAPPRAHGGGPPPPVSLARAVTVGRAVVKFVHPRRVGGTRRERSAGAEQGISAALGVT